MRPRDGRSRLSRGQVHTLEGVIAAMLIITSVVFALQMTSVTPLSASTSSQHIENQQQASAEGVLATAADSGALKRSLLFWNGSKNAFYNTSGQRYYTQKAPPNEFGHVLDQTFGTRGIAYNVYAIYQAGDGSATQRQAMVYVGEPSDNAVRTTRSVVLTNDDRLRDHTENATSTRVVDDAASFYAPDTVSGGVYNVVQVEVIVWRI